MCIRDSALTEHIAIQYGRQNVRCNAVMPPFTKTDAVKVLPPEFVEQYARAVPIDVYKRQTGSVEVRNRTVMSAMGTNMSDHGFVNDAIINHYVERAKGGVGLIIIEVTCVDTPLGLNTVNMLVADDDKYIPGLAKLAAAIHAQGAKCFLQISHTGRGARRKNIGAQPVGPSAVAMPFSYMMGFGNEEPRALTIEEIRTIEDKLSLIHIFIIIVPGYLLLYGIFHLYAPKRVQQRRYEFANICKANLIGFLLVTMVLFLLNKNPYFWNFSKRMVFYLSLIHIFI